MTPWTECVNMLKNLPKARRRNLPKSKFDTEAPERILAWMRTHQTAASIPELVRELKANLSTVRRALWDLMERNEIEQMRNTGKRHFLYTLTKVD